MIQIRAVPKNTFRNKWPMLKAMARTNAEMQKDKELCCFTDAHI